MSEKWKQGKLFLLILLSEVLWWYVNGIQLAKVELLIDRTSSSIYLNVILMALASYNSFVFATFFSFLHKICLDRSKGKVWQGEVNCLFPWFGRFVFLLKIVLIFFCFCFLIFSIIDEAHVYIWNSTCNQSLHNTVIIRGTKLCFLIYIDVITLFGCSVLETRIKLYWYVLFLDQCHFKFQVDHIILNN